MKDLATSGWQRLRRDWILSGGGPRQPDPRLRTARTRLLVMAAAFLLCFGALTARVFELAVISPEDGASRAAAGGEAFASRVDIVDRNGVLLASDLPAHSLHMDPRALLEPERAAAALAGVLPGFDRERFARLAASDSRFAWVRRNLTPDQVYEVNRLGIPGLGFEEGKQRVYPQGRLFSHVLGFTDVDGRGLAGLEMAAGDELRRRAVHGGAALALTLDTRVQHVLVERLESAMTAHRAIGAAGIVMDVENGELLALASLPAFDPRAPERDGPNARFNRATLGTYELGSTFKPFTAAMALDSGAARLEDSYDATKPIKVSRFRIRDHRPENRWLTLPEVLIHSSNIGAARLALDVGADRQKAYMRALGMFEPVPLEMPERGRPIVPRRWGELSTMTIGFGHGIAVTPLHLAAGFAALVNGGVRVAPTLLRERPAPEVEGLQVIGAETSAEVRRLLHLVVDQGTGGKAKVPGYLVGGKTGTAEKAIGGVYRRKTLISTFVGAFPIDRPRYVVLALLDEPKGTRETFGFATAGWTAAPVAGDVIRRIGPMLGVPPSIPPADRDAGDEPTRVVGRDKTHAAL